MRGNEDRTLGEFPDANDGPSTQRWLARGVEAGFFGDTLHSRGLVEAFVCTECGYFEQDIAEPRAVRWEAVLDFHWHERPPPPPYR